MSAPSVIPLIDLQAQSTRINARVEAAIRRVLAHGAFIMGPEIAILEQQLAEFVGVRHAISCSNGTDGLVMALMSKGIGPGDAVFVPVFTFIATAEAVVQVGATPVFVDVYEDSFNMDVASLESAIDMIGREGALRPACIIPVDLFGQPANYTAIELLAAKHGMFVLADACQSFGARWQGDAVGGLGEMTATSFFPAKPLGCYGDGGAVFTDDDNLAATLKSIRVHGQGAHRYDNVRIGINGRLDTIQAAVLIEKLAIFPEEIEARQRVAARYDSGLGDVVVTPTVVDGAKSVWAQYTVVLNERDRVAAELHEAGVSTAVYYPRPLQLQPPYRAFPRAPGGLAVSERLADKVLSLPMHPYLDEATQDRVIREVRKAVMGGR